MTVLIGYASAHGATQGIAERIGAVLSARGHPALVHDLAEPVPPSGYSGYVLGSAVHNQAWLPAARRFVTAHEAALASRPVWLFSVGMPGALRPPLNRWAMREERQLVDGFRGRVHARDHRLFTGVVVPAQLSRFGRLLFRLVGGRYGDFRDWRAIEAWADGIAGALDHEVIR